MRLPDTPMAAVSEMVGLTEELRTTTRAYRQAESDASRKRSAASLSESRAFLNASGAMELRKHLARVEAATAIGEADVAEALVRVLKQEIRTIEQCIDCARTTASTIRAEMSMAGMGQ